MSQDTAVCRRHSLVLSQNFDVKDSSDPRFKLFCSSRPASASSTDTETTQIVNPAEQASKKDDEHSPIPSCNNSGTQSYDQRANDSATQHNGEAGTFFSL